MIPVQSSLKNTFKTNPLKVQKYHTLNLISTTENLLKATMTPPISSWWYSQLNCHNYQRYIYLSSNEISAYKTIRSKERYQLMSERDKYISHCTLRYRLDISTEIEGVTGALQLQPYSFSARVENRLQ